MFFRGFVIGKIGFDVCFILVVCLDRDKLFFGYLK